MAVVRSIILLRLFNAEGVVYGIDHSREQFGDIIHPSVVDRIAFRKVSFPEGVVYVSHLF